MYFICSKYKTNTVVYKENKQGCVVTILRTSLSVPSKGSFYTKVF